MLENDENDLFGNDEGADDAADTPKVDANDDQSGTDDGQDVDQDKSKDGDKPLVADDKKPDTPADAGAGSAEGDEPKDDKEAKTVPKAALDNEKRRRRELTQRLRALEEKEAERERAAIAASAPRPGDAGYEEYQARQTQFSVVNTNLNRSEYDVRKVHGEEKTDEMMAWAQDKFKSDPNLFKTVVNHPHPFDYAMGLYEAELADASKPNDHGDPEYAAFLAFKQAQAGALEAAAAAPNGAAPSKPPAAPAPVSLAQRTSASGPSAPVDSKDPFDREFG